MTSSEPKNLKLLYTLFCDDVRLEAGNKLSFMGVFQNIMVQQIPVSLIKFAVVNHWQGDGSFLSEVRILTPDRKQPVVVSQPTRFEVATGGFADNISFFVNVTFPTFVTLWLAGDSKLTVGTCACTSAPRSSRLKLTSVLVGDC